MTLPAPGRIASLQVGLPRTLTAASGREWTSAIAKAPVLGPVVLEKENLVGDYQANRKYHGGPDKALCWYAAEHYPIWRAEFGLDLPPGAFGENVTGEGLTEDALCIGDVLGIGTSGVRVQISQPRQPCASLTKRWNESRLPRRMEETGWTGFYTRVIERGVVAAGDAVTVLERPNPEWTVLRANQTMYGDASNRESIAALRDLTALSAEWKRILGRMLSKVVEERPKFSRVP